MHRWLVRHIVFPVQERSKDQPTLRLLRDMQTVYRMPVPEVERLRAARLHDLLRYTYSHVPYVRDMMERAGLDPTDIQCPDDLRRLPLTTKADIRENQERLRSRIATKLVPFSTGGSTGSPL